MLDTICVAKWTRAACSAWDSGSRKAKSTPNSISNKPLMHNYNKISCCAWEKQHTRPFTAIPRNILSLIFQASCSIYSLSLHSLFLLQENWLILTSWLKHNNKLSIWYYPSLLLSLFNSCKHCFLSKYTLKLYFYILGDCTFHFSNLRNSGNKVISLDC